MSSRLFIARITTMLLLVLGGFGLAVADSGGGDGPNKKPVTGGKTVFATLGQPTIGGGGNTSPTAICTERTIRINPSIVLGPGEATQSVSYTIAPSFGPIVQGVLGDPLAGFSYDYMVPQSGSAGGNLLISYAVTLTNGSVQTYTTPAPGFTVYAKAAVTPTVTPATACVNSPVSISVAPTPSPAIGAGNSSAAITSLSVTAGAGTTFTAGANTANSQIVTPTVAGLMTYNLAGINAEGCAYVSTATSTAVAAPSNTIAASPNPVCAGTPVSFSVNGTGVTSATVAGAQFSPGVFTSTTSPFISTTTSLPTSASGTFTVSYTLANATGCTAVRTASYTIVALPANGPAVSLVAGTTLLGTGDATTASAPVNGVASIPAANGTPGSSSFTVCQNTTLTLSLSACPVVSTTTSSGTAGGSSSVTVAPGYVIITSANGSQVTVANGVSMYTVPTSVTGTQGYEVACYNSLFCSSTALASFTLTVNPTPVAPTLASAQGPGGSYSVCEGQVFSLTVGCATGSSASATSGGSPVALGAGGVYTSVANAAPGSYTYATTCETASCTSTATNFTLVVVPAPTNGPSLTAVQSGLASNSVAIAATTPTSGGALTVCQGTTILVSVTGCVTTSVISVTNPIVGGTTSTSATGGVNVTANVGGLTTFTITNTFAAATPFVYPFVCTNAAGCSSSAIASLSVTVNPTPGSASIASGVFTTGGTYTLCTTAASFTSVGTANCPTGSSLTSTSSGIVFNGSSFTVTVAPSVTGTTASYVLSCSTALGCVGPGTSFTATIYQRPAAPTPVAAITVCADTPSVLIATGCTSSTATISSIPTVEASDARIVSGSLLIGTTTSGTFVYGVECRTTRACNSTATSYTVIVIPRPDNASLTIVNGTTADRNVAGGTLGRVAICQGASLTINTNCLIATSNTATSGGNTIGGSTSGTSGTAVGGGVISTGASSTFASFTIATTLTGETTYTFVCQNTAGCTSLLTTSLVVTVNETPATPGTVANLSGTFTACQNASLTKGAVSLASSLTNANVCTTANSSLVITNAQGQIVTPADVLNTSVASVTATYFVKCVLGTCESATRTFTTIVNPLPAAPSLTAATGSPTAPTVLTTVAAAASGSVSVCQGSSLTVLTSCLISSTPLSGSGNVATGANSGAINSDGSISSTAVASTNGSTSVVTAAYIISTTALGTTTFTIRCVDPITGCVSTSGTILAVTVSNSVANPTGVVASGNVFANGASTTVCQFSSFSAAVNCPTPGSMAVYSGAQSAGMSPLIVNTQVAGVFAYSVVCRTPAGCASATRAFTVIVVEQPANAAVAVTTSTGNTLNITAGGSATATVCEGTSLTGLVSGCPTTSGSTGGSSATAVGSGQISVGGSTPVSTTNSQNFFVIPGPGNTPLTAGTYNYTVVCTSYTCTSPQATTLVVVVTGAPVSPTAIVATSGPLAAGSLPVLTPTSPPGSYTVCQNSPISLTVNGCNANTPGSTNGTGSQVSGSAVLGGTQIINGGANPSNFTILNTVSGVFQYTVNCTDPVTGCKSLTSLILNVTVNPTPAAPVIAGTLATNVTLCEGTVFSSTVVCPVNSTPSGAQPSGFIFGPIVSSSNGTVASFTATASSLTGTSVYSVSCISTAGACPSLPTNVTITVNPIPANAGLTVSPASTPNPIAGGTGGSLTICQGNPISVTVTGCPTIDTAGSTSQVAGGGNSGFNFGGTQITPGQTGVNTFTVATSITGTFVYTANCTNSLGCSSSAVTSLTVTVNPTPSAPVITAGVTANAVTQACQNSLLVATITCPTGSTLSASPGITAGSSATGTSFTILTGTASTSAYSVSCIATQGGCPSPATNFTVNVNALPNVAALTAVSGSGATTVVTGAAVATSRGTFTVCQGVSLTVNTNCLIGSIQNPGSGNSLTGVNGGSVVGSAGSNTLVGVGTGSSNGGSTNLFASYLLGTTNTGVTTYTFVCINAAGCSSPRATTLTVTVNETPAPPAPVASTGSFPNLVVCETTAANSPLSVTACPVGTSVLVGNSASLAGRITSVPGQQTFTIGTTLPGASTGIVGSLTISCVNSSGCSSSSYVASVTINATPDRPLGATISAGSPTVAVSNTAAGQTANTPGALTVCAGQVVTLAVTCPAGSVAGGAFPISGSGSGFVFSGGTFVPSATDPNTTSTTFATGSLPTGTYTFGVSCTNTAGCQSLTTRSFTLVVTDQASAVIPTGFASTCPPTSVTGTLGCTTGSLSAGFSRIGDNVFTPVTTVAGSGTVVLPAQAGVYSITAICSTGGACIGTPLSFTVNNRLRSPAPTSVQTAQNAICLGQSTTLIAGCATGSTATWYLAGSTMPVVGTVLNGTSLIVSPLQQGTYNYEATCSTTGFACESVRSTQIVLNVLPGVNSIITLSAQPNPSVAGAPVTLTGAGCIGTIIFYVQGSNTELGRGTTTTGDPVSITVNPQVRTIYDAVCTNGQCTSNRSTGTPVAVTPCNFVANVTPSSAVICATGGTVVLTASGGVSYVWNNGANTQQITVSAAGVYSVVVTSAQGCTAVGSATITTGTAPSPTITGNTTIFAGQSTTLTAGGGGLYAWNGPGLAPNAGGASQVVSQAGGYTVTVTSPTGCTASANVTVTVSALPGAPTVTPTATVAPNAPLQACVGQTIQLVASCPTGSTPRFKMGAITNDAATQNVTGSTAGLVTYQVVCVAGVNEGPATAASINFNAVPTVQILQTGQLCSNQPSSITLSATGAASYTWSTGATTQSIVVNTGGTGLYSVNGSNAAGCIGTATQTVTATLCGPGATVLAISGATIDCVNGNVTIAATGGNGNQIQYSIGGVQYQPSNPVALDPAFQNNPANTFIQLFVRQVNSTSTGFDVAGPFQFNFRAICPVTSTTIVTPPVPPTALCGSPANTINGGQVVVAGVTDINCNNGTFRVLTTGGNGQPIDWSVIVGLSNADPFNCTRRVDNGEQLMAINSPNSTITPFEVNGMQAGTGMSTTFSFNFKAACTAGLRELLVGGSTTPAPAPTTPPSTTTAPVASANPGSCGSPANTIGQPLTITGVDQVNCAAGTFRILTTGGNGQTINYANIVGLNNNDPYNCTRTLDNPDLTARVNNPGSDIAPFNLKVLNVGGSSSNTFSFNMKQVCTGVARVVRTEGTGTLDVTVLGNPTLGESVEVEVRGAEGQALQLRLVDGMGAAISEKSVEKAGAVERQTIGLGRSAGMYFLQVTTPDKTKTVKVVRQ